MEIRWMWAFADLPESGFERAVDFWSAATGWAVSARRGERGEFATLLPPQGDAHVKVQAVGGDGGAHLDFAVPDMEGAAREAGALGAEVVRALDDVIVMRSPGDLDFCLVGWDGEQERAPAQRWPGGQTSLLDQVCVDIPQSRFDAEAAFWGGLTGWGDREAGEEFRRLNVPTSLPVRILLQRLGEDAGPVRAHLDFAASERRSEVARHAALGAQELRVQQDWTVLRDPVGVVYCVTDRDPASAPPAPPRSL